MLSKLVRSKLVLVGGGHSHSVALSSWLGQQSLERSPTLLKLSDRPIADITLITPSAQTIYSGSVPGHLAGWWNRGACAVNVAGLAASLGIKVILDEAIGLDLAQHPTQQYVISRNHDPIAFDVLSLDIGSTPQIPAPPSQRIIPMKPMGLLLDSLEPYFQLGLSGDLFKKLSIAIVGGGLGGIEVALSLKERLRDQLDLSLICRSQTIAPTQSKGMQEVLNYELESRSIRVYLNTTVNAVQENTNGVNLILNTGKYHSDLSCDLSLWATEATAPQWIRDSGLMTDDRGFVLVDRTLRSVSHSNIFASGDIATLQNNPQPKAGVFAVRQGPIVAHNLQQTLANRSLQVFNSQSRYLSLVSLGDRRAVASYGKFSMTSKILQPWFWDLKKTIDDGFVSGLNRSSDLH